MAAIDLESVARVPIARAWTAWTDPDELAAWWWPIFDDTTYDLDVRPGGSYRIETATAGIGVRGEYLEVEREQRLVFTWIWIDGGVESDDVDTITVTFEPHAGGTLVRVVHETADAGVGPYKQGWGDCLARFEQIG